MRPQAGQPLEPDLGDTHAVPARARGWLTASALLALVAVLAVRAWKFVGGEIDDVYIDMLHARNLVEHGVIGLDWKGTPTEGFSSPLNVALHALGYRLGLGDGVLAAGKLRAFACAGLVIVATFTLLRRCTRNRALPWIGAALLVASPAFAYWAVAGLETPIYALLVVASVLLLAQPELSLLSAVTLGLLAFTRPEGPMFAVIGVVYLALRLAKEGRPARASLRRHAAWLAVLVLVALPYHVFRWSYFHAIFPNTYYAKINEHVDPWQGAIYLWRFVRESAPWLIAMPLLAWFARGKRDGVLPLAVAFLLAQVAVTVRAGGDWMPYHRFGVHVLPLATVVTLLGVQGVLDVLADRKARASATAAAIEPAPVQRPRGLAGRLLLGAGSLGACIWIVREYGTTRVADLVPHDAIVTCAAQYRVVAQRILAECAERKLDPGEVVVALEPVGIVPYVARTRVLDLSGKADSVIGSASVRFGKGHEREKDLWVAGHVFELAPEFFCLSGGFNPGHQYATVADPRFPLWYEKLADIDTLTIFARRRAPLVLAELHVVDRLDGLQILEPATGRLEAATIDGVAARVAQAVARGDAVSLHVEFDSPVSRLEPLLALDQVRMSWRLAGKYYRTLAFEPGSNRVSLLLPSLPLRAALDGSAPFEPGGPPCSVEELAPPDLRIDCRGADESNLIALRPFDVSGQRVCLIEVSLALERKRGESSGLFWTLYRSQPGPDTRVNGGTALLHGTGEGWRELGMILRIPPEATVLQLELGGYRNTGSVLRVRDVRVLGLARDPAAESR